jgi:hypothetical protein
MKFVLLYVIQRNGIYEKFMQSNAACQYAQMIILPTVLTLLGFSRWVLDILSGGTQLFLCVNNVTGIGLKPLLYVKNNTLFNKLTELI